MEKEITIIYHLEQLTQVLQDKKLVETYISKHLNTKINKEMISMEELTEKHDIAELKSILTEYKAATSSSLASAILENFESYLPYFKKIVPNDYHRMLSAISRYEEKGLSHDEAALEAFYEVQK